MELDDQSGRPGPQSLTSMSLYAHIVLFDSTFYHAIVILGIYYHCYSALRAVIQHVTHP
jgi:hypothetical protein